MTYSVLAFDPEYKRWGVATASKYLGVGGIVPRVYDGIGGFLTQAQGNYDFHLEALKLLSGGITAAEVLKHVLERDTQRESRQLAALDAFGNIAAFTGRECSPVSGHRMGENHLVIGNLLASDRVLDVMHSVYEAQSVLPFVDRLVHTLQAGEHAGGDRRGKQSAAVQISKGSSTDGYIDLRVDDHVEPLDELARLVSLSREFSQRVRISAG